MMSNYFEEVLQEALKDLAQRIQDGRIRFPPTDDIFYEELSAFPNIIDSTATVIDENVKALPVPMQE
jgi:hypothetical protein